MNFSITVVLTDTTIGLVSRNAVLTSIPLRHWTSNDGSKWSSRLRPDAEVTWLMDRLRTVLRNEGDESVMKRVSQVMSEEPPRVSPKKREKSLRPEAKAISRRVPALTKSMPQARYMLEAIRDGFRMHRPQRAQALE
jgi:hypothetical protein